MKTYSKIITVAFAISLFFLCHIGIKTGYFQGTMIKTVLSPPSKDKTLKQDVEDIPIMQKATEKGWENCLRQMNIKSDVVFYGDSITRNGLWQEWIPTEKVINLGLGGDNLIGLKRRIGMVVSLQPSKVFVMGGINGIKNMTYSEFYAQYSNLCQHLVDSLPNAKIYLQSILPIDRSRFGDYAPNDKIDSFNRIIENLAIQYNMTFVDLFPKYLELQKQEQIYVDGIHLKEKYYTYWVEKIKVYLEQQ